MVSITLSIPEEIRKTMKESPDVNWSHIVRQAIIEKTQMLEIKKQILKELEKEKEFNDWAVEIIRKGRK